MRSTATPSTVWRIVIGSHHRTASHPRSKRNEHVERSRSAMHQHDPVSVGGCRAESQQRPSGHADGRGVDGLCAMDAIAQAQSAQSAVGGSRPFRALGRARVDAALQPAAPDRLRPVAGRHQAVPPVGQQGTRAPRARTYARRGGHHRAVGTGPGECGRHGDRRGATRGALQPCGSRDHRSSHVCDCQRRRSDGRRCLGSGFARRTSQAWQTDLPVRRQLRHSCRRHRYHIFGRSRQTLRGLRLAHRIRCRWQRSGCNRRRAAKCACRNDTTLADPGAHAYRLRFAAQARQLRGAWIAAGCRRGAPEQAESRLADRSAIPDSRACVGAFPRSGRSRCTRRSGVGPAPGGL